MAAFIIGIIIFVCIILVLLILAQDSKGSGLTGNIGAASQIMGTRRTTDWIEKATWGFLVALFVLSLGVNASIEKTSGPNFTSPNIEKAKSEAIPSTGLELPESSDENSDAIESTDTEDLLDVEESSDSIQ
ncbi:MAG: preprotein translocase subunit SecG [Thalassobius sp.]|nr:preprotein translocase subunit SecG [Thalassovita sp.]